MKLEDLQDKLRKEELRLEHFMANANAERARSMGRIDILKDMIHDMTAPVVMMPTPEELKQGKSFHIVTEDVELAQVLADAAVCK